MDKEVDLSGADLSNVPYLSFERTEEDRASEHTVRSSKNDEEVRSEPDVKNKREKQQEMSSEFLPDGIDMSSCRKVDLSHMQEQVSGKIDLSKADLSAVQKITFDKTRGR